MAVVLIGICIAAFLYMPSTNSELSGVNNAPRADRVFTPKGTDVVSAHQETTVKNVAAQSYPSNAVPPEEVIRKTINDLKRRLVAPIAFFGKVVDNKDHPVSEVRVTFEWNNPSFPVEATRHVTLSDSQGQFSLENVSGINLSLTLEKTGYYVSRENATFSYIYSPELQADFHRPDPGNPIIFRVWPRGQGTDLITSKQGISQFLVVKLPRDGTPRRVDLLNGRAGAEGQLELAQIKPDYNHWREATNWQVRVSIPDGGILEHMDEFPFLAPESGYSPNVLFVFDRTKSNWSIDMRKQFYIRLGTPDLYGRLVLDTAIEKGSIRLLYAINPAGSRNLEPAEPKPIKRELSPGVTEVIPDHAR